MRGTCKITQKSLLQGYDPLQVLLLQEHMPKQSNPKNYLNNTPYLFNGKELDEETGLYYYGARYYNPRETVWLSVDPLAGYNPVMETEHYIDGQHNGGVYNSGNLNPYGYCYQSPVRFIDPNGKQVGFDYMLGTPEAIQAAAFNQMNPEAQTLTGDVIKDALVAIGDDIGDVLGPVIRQLPQQMQSVGDKAAVVGYVLTAAGATSEVGVPLATAGNVVSWTGTGLEFLIDLYDGKYSKAGGDAVKTIIVEGGQKVISSKIDKIPGASEVKKEFLKQTVDMTVKAVENTTKNTNSTKSTNSSSSMREYQQSKPGRNRQQILKNFRYSTTK